MLNTKPYKKAAREMHPINTLVHITNEVVFGREEPIIIAGPCAIESYEQILKTARAVKNSGAKVLRGGAYKPRTSPYSFQGLKQEGLEMLSDVGRKMELPVVAELLSTDDIPLFKEHVQIIQIGTRNMQNFDLLEKAADSGKPILLKRGFASTMQEFLLAAEYILNRGNPNVVLCERGIRTFETSTRNILDLNTLALIKIESHLPIIADPSHAAGRYDLVAPLGRAALAVGANGLIVEVHPNPEEAFSDGPQSLTCQNFDIFMKSIH